MGLASGIANWLNLLFLQVFNSGAPLPSESFLNFTGGLSAADNPGTMSIDVTLNGAGTLTPQVTANTSLPSSPGKLLVQFSSQAGSLTITMPGAPALGAMVTGVDVWGGTSVGNSVSFTDPNYQIQDPDTLAVSSHTYPLTARRNLTWVLVKDIGSNHTFWAASP